MPESLPLVLASNSPRRRELLALGDLPFVVQAADLDETPKPGESPPDYVLRLAVEKARAASEWLEGDSLVLAADTTVALDNAILGKPEDAGEARRILRSLRGRVHQVYTGIALLRTADGALLQDLATAQVPMRDYADAEIEAYIATGDPFDKAGSYAIRHAGFHPVAEMAGCFASVVGLPLCHLTRSLRKWELDLGVDIPAACQAYLDYDCPVFEGILAWEQ